MTQPARRRAPDMAAGDRILQSALHLFQARGYHGVGLNDILHDAQAPKGCLYHHFPAGKAALAEAALALVRGRVDARIRDQRALSYGAGTILRGLAADIAAWLRRTRWQEGTLASVIAQDHAADAAGPARAVRDTYDHWRAQLAAILREDGAEEAAAASLAHMAMAVLEGGAMLARLDRATNPYTDAIDLVAALMDAAAPPPLSK